eukprot:Filipodium_phascolosomae@DN623_c0_g1_i1.p1
MEDRKLLVIDGKGHLFGRLANQIAKDLLLGEKVAVVRCEEMSISGPVYRNHLKMKSFLRKTTNSNPLKGPFHHKSPARIFKRCVRGKLPRKTLRGQRALARLWTYEGVPEPFMPKRKLKVWRALRCLQMNPRRPVTRLGTLAKLIGWKHDDTVKRIEAKKAILYKQHYDSKSAEERTRYKVVQEVKKGLPESLRNLLDECGVHVPQGLNRIVESK